MRIEMEPAATDAAAGFLDDPVGLTAALDAIDALAHDARPAESFAQGSPDRRRLTVGAYRIWYVVLDDVVLVSRLARFKGGRK